MLQCAHCNSLPGQLYSLQQHYMHSVHHAQHSVLDNTLAAGVNVRAINILAGANLGNDTMLLHITSKPLVMPLVQFRTELKSYTSLNWEKIHVHVTCTVHTHMHEPLLDVSKQHTCTKGAHRALYAHTCTIQFAHSCMWGITSCEVTILCGCCNIYKCMHATLIHQCLGSATNMYKIHVIHPMLCQNQ